MVVTVSMLVLTLSACGGRNESSNVAPPTGSPTLNDVMNRPSSFAPSEVSTFQTQASLYVLQRLDKKPVTSVCAVANELGFYSPPVWGDMSCFVYVSRTSGYAFDWHARVLVRHTTAGDIPTLHMTYAQRGCDNPLPGPEVNVCPIPTPAPPAHGERDAGSTELARLRTAISRYLVSTNSSVTEFTVTDAHIDRVVATWAAVEIRGGSGGTDLGPASVVLRFNNGWRVVALGTADTGCAAPSAVRRDLALSCNNP
jgi:hypothetical protein